MNRLPYNIMALPLLVGCLDYNFTADAAGTGVEPTLTTDSGDFFQGSDSGDFDEPDVGEPDFREPPGRPEGPPVGCWYTHEEASYTPVNTNPDYRVDSYGDPDLYYYEPSGGHGGLFSLEGFWTIRDYVVANAQDAALWDAPTSFETPSTIQFTQNAHFTYYVCEWVVGEDTGDWSVRAGILDDGMLVLLNGTIVGSVGLSEDLDFPIEIVDGELNTLILIHVDNASTVRRVIDMGLYVNGELFEGILPE